MCVSLVCMSVSVSISESVSLSVCLTKARNEEVLQSIT